MKFKIKIECEEELEASDEQEAIENFWEDKHFRLGNLEGFLDDITSIEVIK